MNTAALILCCCLPALPLAGQSLLQQLATEVCTCMTTGEIVYPRLQAGRCIEDVAMAHPRRIQDELQLSVLLAADRRRLGELLVDPLAEHCAALQALRPAAEPEPELSYSDFPLARAANVPPVAKYPPPDPAGRTARDAPHSYRAAGELLGIDQNVIRLLLDSGHVLTLAFEARQLRRTAPRIGQRLEVRYREDWSLNASRVTYVLLEMR